MVEESSTLACSEVELGVIGLTVGVFDWALQGVGAKNIVVLESAFPTVYNSENFLLSYFLKIQQNLFAAVCGFQDVPKLRETVDLLRMEISLLWC